MTIKITTATEADKLLKDAKFQEEWQALYRKCPWATPFQGSGFVTTWYEVYQDQYHPVIVRQLSSEGALTGLLTLAISGDSKQLVVAGTHQAEYQVWLAYPEYGNTFIENAVKKLQKEFPNRSLGFTYLPPSTPTEWTNSDQLYGPYCLLEMHRRPLMMVGDGSQISASLRKKSNKSRLNRLKRLGEMRFEQISDTSELASIFDEIIQCYDFRQGAINNSYPFQSDPLKKSFYLALMKVPNLSHVTVLKVGDAVVAAHLGVCSKKEVYLGVFAQNPFYAKYSPGKFHLLMLGQKLVKQGFSALDLTPGGDPWKERFATDHDEVRLLKVFFNRRSLIQLETRRKLEKVAKQVLQRFRVSPQSIKTVVAKLQRFITTHGILQLWKRLWSRIELRIYAFKTEKLVSFEQPVLMSKDCLEELLVFQQTPSGQTRSDFMFQSLKRIENGGHIYTYIEDGKLLFYAWLMEQQKKLFFPEVEQEFQFPPNSVLLFDYSTHPQVQKRSLDQPALSQMLHDAIALPDTKQVYIAVPSDNKHLRHTIEDIGFTYESSLFKTSTFDKIKQWPSKYTAEAESQEKKKED